MTMTVPSFGNLGRWEVNTMSEVRLNTFPSNKIEALAMLYLQNRDLKNKTPEQLLDMYYEAYERLYEHKSQYCKGSIQTFK